jgi:hypothetical protein
MSSLFKQDVPKPPPPQTMPDPMSPATLEARRKAIADTLRGGRQSTILTTAASRAGGTLAGQSGTYAGQKTGNV